MLQTVERIQAPVEPHKAVTPRRISYFSWWLPALALIWSALYFTLCPDSVNNFKHWYSLIGVGFGAAIAANISAIGGGIVFIPSMLFCYHLPAVTALKIAIGTQAIGMSVGAITWSRTKIIPYAALAYTVPGLIIGSTVSSLIIHPNALLVKTIFGPVSIGVGILTLYMLNRIGGSNNLPLSHRRTPLFLLSVVGGLVTGWISIGEGELIAGYLMLACGLSTSQSIGLGVALMAINSIYLSLIHTLFLGGIPWHLAAFTILGTLFGAPLAPYLSQLVSHRTLKIIFAAIAIADGIIFLLQALSHGIR